MRYIIFKKGAIQTPAIYPDFVDSSSVKLSGNSVVSQGECEVLPLMVKPENPKRAKEDWKLLKALFTNASKSSFFNEEEI